MFDTFELLEKSNKWNIKILLKAKKTDISLFRKIKPKKFQKTPHSNLVIDRIRNKK